MRYGGAPEDMARRQADVECLRIEAGMYGMDKTGKITKAYREAIDKRVERGCEGEYTAGHYFRGGGVRMVLKWV